MAGTYTGPWALVHALLATIDPSVARATVDAHDLATRVLGHEPVGELGDAVHDATSVPEIARVLLAHTERAQATGHVRERIQAELVRELAFSGDPVRAEQLARGLLEPEGPDRHRPAVWTALVHALLVQGRWQDLVWTVDEALQHLGGVPETVARLRAERSLAHLWIGDLDAARDDAEHALRIGGETADAVAASRGAAHLSVVVGNEGDVEAAVALAQRGLELAAEDDDAMRLHPHLALGMALYSADRLDEALDALRIGRRVGEERRTAWDLPLYDAMIAVVHQARGEWDDALAEARTGLQLSEMLGSRVGRVGAHGVIASIDVRRARFAQAEESIAQARAELAERGPQWGEWFVERAHVALRAATGDLEPATMERAAAWRAAPVLGRWLHGFELAVLAFRCGRPDLVRELDDWARDARPAGHPTAEAAAAVARGLLTDDPSRIRAAAATLHSAGRRPDELVAHEVAGELAATVTGPEAAVADWQRAHDLAVSLDAAHDVARLAARLRDAGAPPGPRSPHRTATSGWEALTPTELRVAQLVASGLTNPEVGERLFISRRTVQSHLSNVYRKLDISSRVQLAAIAVERGSVSP